ncbi:MAG TPA: hypothetical protein VGT40_00885 [Methylomirabilota bacterium]|jgi:hypothetical protein|nr:hypothetical protein [Methylomirabilota bacterium]
MTFRFSGGAEQREAPTAESKIVLAQGSNSFCGYALSLVAVHE